jgi:hypothetical protein
MYDIGSSGGSSSTTTTSSSSSGAAAGSSPVHSPFQVSAVYVTDGPPGTATIAEQQQTAAGQPNVFVVAAEVVYDV